MLAFAALALGLSLVPDAPTAPSTPDGEEAPLYLPGGRRDPFLQPGATESHSKLCPGRGLAGFRIRELALRGLIRTPSGPVAMLLAPDQRSYFAVAGERLCDGALTTITPDGVVFVEHIDDALTDVRTRAVVRPLHP